MPLFGTGRHRTNLNSAVCRNPIASLLVHGPPFSRAGFSARPSPERVSGHRGRQNEVVSEAPPLLSNLLQPRSVRSGRGSPATASADSCQARPADPPQRSSHQSKAGSAPRLRIPRRNLTHTHARATTGSATPEGPEADSLPSDSLNTPIFRRPRARPSLAAETPWPPNAPCRSRLSRDARPPACTVHVSCGLLPSLFLDGILMTSFPDRSDAPRWIVILADHRGFDLRVLDRRLP